jgi:hypothetical protein
MTSVSHVASQGDNFMLPMTRMAKSAKNPHGSHIKVTPRYIDYKLAMVAQ